MNGWGIRRLIRIFRLWFGGQGRCRLGRGWLSWRGWCRGRHLRGGWWQLLRMPLGERGGLMIGNGGRFWLRICLRQFQVLWGELSLNGWKGTFALEGGSLDEEVGGFLVSFDLAKCDGSRSPSAFLDASGDGCWFPCNLLWVEVFLGGLLRALLGDGFGARHLLINIICYFK